MSLSDIKGMLRLEEHSFKQVAKRKDGVRDAHIILFTVALIASSLSYLLELFFVLPLLDELMSFLGESLDIPALSAVDFVAGVIASVFFAIALTWLWAVLTKWFATMLGAKKGGVKEYFAVFGHAYSIRIISWVPIIGFFVWVYNVVVNVKGVSALSGLSIGKSAAAYLLPALIVGVLFLFLLIGFIVLAIFAGVFSGL